jgi:DNA-binding transcriptional LysR family regulator
MGRLKPDIQLSYVSSDPNEVISELFLDKADVIVVPKFPPPQTMELVYHDLYQERLCVLVSRVNPLAQKKSVSFADLANETFLSVSNNYFLNFWKFVHQLCEESGFEPKEPVLLNQMESALFAVQRNEGIIVVGDHMRKFASEDVAYLELADGNCRRTVSLCYKTGNPIFDDFAKVFLAVFLGQTE